MKINSLLIRQACARSCYREMCKVYRGGDYQKWCDPEKEILVNQDDIKKPTNLCLCDYCEKESDLT
jgi:hypothetical protein